MTRLLTALGQLGIRLAIGSYIISIIANIGNCRTDILNIRPVGEIGYFGGLLFEVDIHLFDTIDTKQVFFDSFFTAFALNGRCLDLYRFGSFLGLPVRNTGHKQGSH